MQIGVEVSRLVENKRVFVIDDDDITRTVLQFMLQDDNETHEMAALDAAFAQASRGVPDVVLIGLSLVRGGARVLADIAAHWPAVRVVLVTEEGSERDAQPYLAAGAIGVLSKPFKVENVRRKVDIALGRIKPSLVQLSLVPTEVAGKGV